MSTQDRLVSKLIQLGEEHPERVAECSYTTYTCQRYEGDTNPRVEDVRVSCIVGHAVYELGLMSLEDLITFDINVGAMYERAGLDPSDVQGSGFEYLNRYYHAVHGEYLADDPHIAHTIRKVQSEQDDGTAWGDAIRYLEES